MIDNRWLDCGQEGFMLLVRPLRRNFETGANET
jgi:hypothetical protein